MTKKIVGTIVVLVTLLTPLVSPIEEITEVIWQNLTYKKDTAEVYFVNEDGYSDRSIAVMYKNSKNELLTHYMDRNSYNFYHRGMTITTYWDPETNRI